MSDQIITGEKVLRFKIFNISDDNIKDSPFIELGLFNPVSGTIIFILIGEFKFLIVFGDRDQALNNIIPLISFIPCGAFNITIALLLCY